MTNREDIVKILESHFQEHGWPLDVGREKLYDRYRVVSDEADTTRRIVEIERHRPILGDTYTRGLPMNAFETYFLRYSVDPETMSVKALPERLGDVEIDINGLAESEIFQSVCLEIESVESLYRVRDGVSNMEMLVSSLAETKEFAISLAEPLADYFYERLLDHGTIEEELQERLFKEYQNALEAELLEQAVRLWGERDD
ncbi:hypothetical protein [Fluviibacter phosphoraccumulans]|uniref:hypothetical protein n=1 Tax=Fluviibacter phosphoraccumulans TaxID=1751046 RepID=UPI0024E1A8F8|nr:hypothetical protein [Fluviibacter phosphoraccumulans]